MNARQGINNSYETRINNDWYTTLLCKH